MVTGHPRRPPERAAPAGRSGPPVPLGGSDTREERVSEDGYTGHVEPDGPWIERTDGALFVRKLSVESMDNNVYVIACTRTGQALLVDAAARPDRLRQALDDVEPIAVVQSHGHFDHIRAWEDLRRDPGLPIWGHPADRGLFPADPDRHLEGGETLRIGDVAVEVLHTPGHTQGSLQFLVRAEGRPHLFSGDSLFPGGLGRTTSGTLFEQLFQEVTSKVFDHLPDETWVYPGHGDDTTLGAERPDLDEWWDRGW